MRFIVVVVTLIALGAPQVSWAEAGLIESLRDLASLARCDNSYHKPVRKLREKESRLRKRPSHTPYWKIISRAGHLYKVDPYLVRAVIKHESSFNSRAVSAKGAQGLMQLMPQTAREVGVRNSFDPVQNIDGGTRYLRQMIDQFGSLYTALLAYNAGPGKVSRGRIPSESHRYASRVLHSYYNERREG